MTRKRKQRIRVRFPCRLFYFAVPFAIAYCVAVYLGLKNLSERKSTISSPFENLLNQSAQHGVKRTPSRSVPKRITAFLEPRMNVTIPGTASRGDPDKVHDKGRPPKYIEPLPLRLSRPQDLRKVEYSTIQSCRDVPSKLPVGRPLTKDDVWNIGDAPLPENYKEIELPFCPVDSDPYLPWIHDLFLDLDQSQVRFVAQNRRRCRTGRGYGEVLESLQPQTALFQPVSVEVISENEAQGLAPRLWRANSQSNQQPRYRLSPLNKATEGGNYTRFICKFHVSSSDESRIELGQTLSEYPFNYELAEYRKSMNNGGLLTSKGKDNSKFWTSTLLFSCPLTEQAKSLAKASSVVKDGPPLFHVDIIPIRTPPRFAKSSIDGGYYFPEELVGSNHKGNFDPLVVWGPKHVLPPIEASGRWENLPVCSVESSVLPSTNQAKTAKPHLLSACLWASAIYRTRGKDKESLSDTKYRLLEWIEFHLMAGFDHIYVYDNSADDVNNLQSITDMFSSKEIPAHDNTGERSSQYAAENSCRTRYAPLTEWIASFDTDEYLVPMGKHTSLRSVVEQAKGTNILSFRSSRGKLRYKSSYQHQLGRLKLPNVTFLEAYNCDGSESPRPEWADRARKQLYRADYVPYHFVHYSTITRGLLDISDGESLSSHRFYIESSSSERVTDELNEATMIHAKTITLGHTAGWKKRCRYDFNRKWLGCFVGIGWPDNTKSETNTYDPNNELAYNCFVNMKVENYWIPKLIEALQARKHKHRHTK